MSEVPGSSAFGLRTGALIRHNLVQISREPGLLASRLVTPLAFLILLHPLYEQAQHGQRGVAQAVIGLVAAARAGRSWGRSAGL